MSVPWFAQPLTVSNPAFSGRTIPYLGSYTLKLTRSTASFNLTATKKGPRFFGMDGTGGYFGLGGYYRSYPCWAPWNNAFPASIFGVLPSYPYQMGLFTTNSTGIFDVSYLLANPFQYHAQLSDTGQAAGQLPFAGASTTAALSAGYAKIWSRTYSSNAPQDYSAITQWPSISFANTSGPLSGYQHPNTMPWGSDLALRLGPSFIIYDDLGQDYLISYSFINGHSRLISTTYGGPTGGPTAWGGYLSIAAALSSNSMEPVVVTKRGRNSAVDTIWGINGANPGAVNMSTMKVHPGTGTFLYGGTTLGSPQYPVSGVYSGTVFCATHVAGTVATCATRDYTTFSNPADNTAIQNASQTIQIQQPPGGGFILGGSTLGNIVYFVMPDLSGYYKVALSTTSPNAIYTGSTETFNLDINGNFWYLDYGATGGSSFQNVYSTVGQSPPIFLTNPDVTSFASMCRVPSCSPWDG